MMHYLASLIFQAICLFLLATIIFDCLHFLLHWCLKSKIQWLRRIGSVHLPHHRFYNSKLKIVNEYLMPNILAHVLFENVTQYTIILCGLIYFDPAAVILAAFFQVLIFLFVLLNKGVDPHHRSYDKLPPYRGGWYVTSDYHALHHHYLSNYYSSYIKVLDFLLGTGHHLANKKIVMTGANGALGSSLRSLLQREGAEVICFQYGKDYQYGHYDQFIPALKTADILVLCHGSKYLHAQEANCDSYVALIELYKKVHERDLLAPEVWATGSEIECHPCFGIEKIKVYAASKRNYAKFARQYYHDTDLQYRHLVHSSFISPMGPGLMTARFAAFATLFLIKRGFRYVPVSYTGFGWLNYLRFLFRF